MALAPPRTLSPSKVSAFTSCPLAFRFSQIERLPEPPSPHAVKGTLVHSALERLFWHHRPGTRTPEAAQRELDAAWAALQDDEEFVALGLTAEEAASFLADARDLVANCFALEDPNATQTVGVELGVEAVVDGMRLRGIIDRLDLGPDGRLIVVDYKTGRAPGERYERGQPGRGAHLRPALRERAGPGPAEVRLLYLRQPVTISTAASEPRPSAASASGPWPCGRPSSAPAPPRTSGPRWGRSVARATSRRPAPPSPREAPPMSTVDETVDAAFEPLRGRPGVDRAATVVSNLADYGLRLGGPGRPQGAPQWARPAARRRGARRGRRLFVAGQPGRQGGRVRASDPTTTSTRPCARRRPAASRAATRWPPSARPSCWATATPRRRPTCASPAPWPPVGSTCGPTTRLT